ncbi:MAG: Gfo/Idh/MocA family oxidoreductase [Phycisphaerae bacterium]|nr:Gfo/Idh/MocA family oxidoreductase [Phycisphaerae bacterium]
MAQFKTSRRQFLKGSVLAGGALAFPVVVPSTVFGALAPSNRIVMGCIGTGGRGTGNMKAFLGEAEVQMAALCDVDASRRGKARDIVNQKYGNTDCAEYSDFREMLAKAKLDAVMIATPDHWHALTSIAAARAGADIYCEKTLVNTVAEGIALVKAVKRYGRVLQTGSHERSNAKARFAAELVQNGRIGKLHTVQINLPVAAGQIASLNDRDTNMHSTMPIPEGFDYDMWLGHTPVEPYTVGRCHGKWRFVMNYGGGEMTDRGAHVIDQAQLGCGTDDTTPVEYQAQGKRGNSRLYDTFYDYTFECRYANGVRMIGTHDEPRGVKFIGDKGWVFIHVHGGDLEAEPKSLLAEKIGPDEKQLGRTVGHHRNFLDAIKTRQAPMAPVEVGHHTATICHLINISLQLGGRRILWDPKAEEVKGDAEANGMLSRPMRSPWRL